MKKEDKLYSLLKNMNIPLIPNKKHQSELFQHLKKIAEEEQPEKTTDNTGSGPGIKILLSAAAFVVVFISFGLLFTNNYKSGPAERDSFDIFLSSKSGRVLADGKGDEDPAEIPAGQNDIKTISTFEGSSCTFQIDDSIVVKLEENSSLSFRKADTVDDKYTVFLKLEKGTGYFKTSEQSGKKIIVETEHGSFKTIGTSFMLKVLQGEKTILYVIDGIINIISDNGTVLCERVSAGQNVWVDSSSNIGIIDEPPKDMLEKTDLFNLIKPADIEKDIVHHVISINSRPEGSLIDLNNGISGKGTLTFTAEPGKEYSISISMDGYVTRTIRRIFDENLSFDVILEKAEERYDGGEEKSLNMETAADAEDNEKTIMNSSGEEEIDSAPDDTRIIEDNNEVIKDNIETSEDNSTLIEDNEEKTDNDDIEADEADSPEIPVIFFTADHLDSNFTSWKNIKALINDDSGDSAISDPGSDISEVYLAKSNEYLFAGIKLANGDINEELSPEIILSLDSTDIYIKKIRGKYTNQKWQTELETSAGETIIMDARESGMTESNGSFIFIRISLDELFINGFIPPKTEIEFGVMLKMQKYQRLVVTSDETDFFRVRF